MDLVTHLIREPSVEDAPHYRRRARQLAAVYGALFAGSCAGLVLLVRWAKLYVALAQRSNVETLTLALGLSMFLILAAMSLPGARGAAEAAAAGLVSLRAGPAAAERFKARVLERRGRRDEPVRIVLNAVLQRAERPGPMSFEVADEAGDLGRIVVDGAVVRHEGAFKTGSNSLLAYFVEQVQAAAARRDRDAWIDIVGWSLIDGEGAARQAALTVFARRLEDKLQAPLWPRVELREEDERWLAERLREAAPCARLEALLPDWEYSGEHKLPVIPEPLGFLTLTRSESRVDPLSSMSFMLAVLLFCVALLAVFVVLPPWVPAR